MEEVEVEVEVEVEEVGDDDRQSVVEELSRVSFGDVFFFNGET